MQQGKQKKDYNEIKELGLLFNFFVHAARRQHTDECREAQGRRERPQTCGVDGCQAWTNDNRKELVITELIFIPLIKGIVYTLIAIVIVVPISIATLFYLASK